MRALIVASGEFARAETLRACATQDTLVIAADGGARHCLASGILPGLVIGDMDSLNPDLVEELAQRQIEILRFDTRKDETDLELAFTEAAARAARKLLVFGAFGGREDHALANLLLAASPVFEGLATTFFGAGMEAHVLHAGRALPLAGASGDTISLLPVGGGAHGVFTEGLEYPLQDEDLPFGTPRGLSNVLRGQRAEVRLRAGCLLIFHYHRERPEEAAEPWIALEDG